MDPFLTTDTHFGYTGKGEGIERPVDFSERLLKNLKNVLSPKTILIHLGDVCYVEDEKWHTKIAELPGKKWLITGNHDKKSMSWFLEHGWDFVGYSISLEIYGKHILFSHMPMITDISMMGPKGYIEYKYDMNIHGHFHNFGIEKVKLHEPHLLNRVNKKHFLLSVEELNYIPIKLKRVVELFNTGKYYGLKDALTPISS